MGEFDLSPTGGEDMAAIVSASSRPTAVFEAARKLVE